MDEYRRPIHPEIEEYMRRHVSDDQDWEQVDDQDCLHHPPYLGGGTTRDKTVSIFSRICELLNLGASSSQKLFQSLITNQDLLRLWEDTWPNHKPLRKGWWCRAIASAINRQCPTCNRLWSTEQFPPSLTQCLTCSRAGTKRNRHNSNL